MLTEKEFLQRVFEGVPLPGAGTAAATMVDGFDTFDDETTEAVVEDGSFARRLLESSGFGPAETLPTTEVILGGDPAARNLPTRVYFWGKDGRTYQTLLFELDLGGLALLDDNLFREERKQRQLEDAVHRLIQFVLTGFEKGGEGRTADVKKGPQAETLVVLSVKDDREGGSRHLVCFGTRCVATSALEVFTLREEARDWDRPLAEEHLRQLFQRHFKKLGDGDKWQDAFVSGKERAQARRLMDEYSKLIPDSRQIEDAVRTLLDEIAGSFGVKRKEYAGGKQRLPTFELPENHGIGVSPQAALKKGFKNPLKGFRVFDADERLLGYIVYVADKKADADKLREQIRINNHFHNVLVVYPEQAGATLELWQGTTPLRGRLVGGLRQSRFDGEGGIVQLLSRFIVVSKSPISTPAHLAMELAWRAQHLRELASEELKAEDRKGTDGALRKLQKALSEALAKIDDDAFADAYAQTITYGLLAARWLSKDDGRRFTRRGVAELLPSTSPFLRDLFKKLVNEKFEANLEWLLDDLASLLSRTMVREVFSGEKDPSIHFYQDFLDAYDPQIRKDRGVYYTPDEVVSYIVRTTHTALQDPERFGLRLGLADTTPWGEFAKARGIPVPAGIDPKEPFVQVLDPATGTGTFILRVIEVIHETMLAEYARLGYSDKKARTEWVKYVRTSLLPRINAFELMMAPYIVCHLRLGLALERTGFTFTPDTRLRLHLTNSLEPGEASQAGLLPEFMTAEAQRANTVKLETPVTVLVMNPPYARHSHNFGDWITSLTADYRRGFPELDKPAQGKALADDYVKFMRLGQHHLERVGTGVMCVITNHGYVDNPTFRGLRKRFLETFTSIHIVDLDGNSRRRDLADDEVDENVFNIQQGVAVALMHRAPRPLDFGKVTFTKLRGLRTTKFAALSSHLPNSNLVLPSPPNYLFSGTMEAADGWDAFVPLPRLMGVYGDPAPGFVTTHDEFAISWSPDEAIEKVERLINTANEEEARSVFRLCTTEQWSYSEARSYLSTNTTWRKQATRVLYRPFDWRYTIWSEHVNVHRRDRAAAHMFRGTNLALVTVRQVTKGEFTHALVSDCPTELKLASHDRNSQSFPLWLYSPDGSRMPNFDSRAAEDLGFDIGTDSEVLALFQYVYAIMYSHEYRNRFVSRLRAEFPAIPATDNRGLRRQLVDYGGMLVDAHLLRGDVVQGVAVAASRRRSFLDRTVRPGFPKHRDGRLWINAELSVGPVSDEAWQFGLGGYPVLQKWVKSRVERSFDDGAVDALLRVTGAIERTIEVMRSIDDAIAVAGGWNNAFRGATNGRALSRALTAEEIPPPTDVERKEPKIERNRQGRMA